MKRALKFPPSASALPSITELGRMLGETARREAAIDLMPSIGKGEPANEVERSVRVCEERRRRTADVLLFRRLDAFRELVSTLPAITLSDCAVQVAVAGHMIAKVCCNDLEQEEREELSDAVERIMISVLPVLAAAAGLDLVEFAFDELTTLHDGRFPDLAT